LLAFADDNTAVAILEHLALVHPLVKARKI